MNYRHFFHNVLHLRVLQKYFKKQWDSSEDLSSMEKKERKNGGQKKGVMLRDRKSF